MLEAAGIAGTMTVACYAAVSNSSTQLFLQQPQAGLVEYSCNQLLCTSAWLLFGFRHVAAFSSSSRSHVPLVELALQQLLQHAFSTKPL
jgi:hypothetical protein